MIGRRTVFVLLLVGVFAPAAAQPNASPSLDWRHQIFLHVGPQFPVGSFADTHAVGVGLRGGYAYRVSRKVSLGVFLGFNHFRARFGNDDRTVVPVTLSASYTFLNGPVRPYGQVQGSLASVHNDLTGSSRQFGLSPAVGVRIPILAGFDLDVHVRYAHVFSRPSDVTFAGTHAGAVLLPEEASVRVPDGDDAPFPPWEIHAPTSR